MMMFIHACGLPKVAYVLNGLATLYLEQGRYAQAEPLYKRSLAIWEKALGPDDPTAAYVRLIGTPISSACGGDGARFTLGRNV